MGYRFLSLLLGISIAVFNVAAQNSNEVEITAEPHHHLVLHNKYVRVFRVEVPPHEVTLMHRHHHDYAYVTLGSADISNEVEGKRPIEVKLQDGETKFSTGNFAHIARNLSNAPFRNITIEFLRDAKAGKADAGRWAERRGMQILNGGTQEILFVQDGVRASDVQLNPGGMLPRQKTAAQLIVCVTSLDLRTASPAGSMRANVGDIRWLNTATELMNAAQLPARFIVFEF